jgi:hypothetical protein
MSSFNSTTINSEALDRLKQWPDNSQIEESIISSLDNEGNGTNVRLLRATIQTLLQKFNNGKPLPPHPLTSKT